MLTPSIRDLEKARREFEEREQRDLFYRAATELVALSLKRKISLNVAESVAVLLQTWNKMFYQYQKFDSQHFAGIERLISRHYSALMGY